MAYDADSLDQIRKVVREENEPIKKDLQDVKQILAGTNSAQEALKVGQDDIRENMATKADVLDLGAKLGKVTNGHETRIRELEKTEAFITAIKTNLLPHSRFRFLASPCFLLSLIKSYLCVLEKVS